MDIERFFKIKKKGGAENYVLGEILITEMFLWLAWLTHSDIKSSLTSSNFFNSFR